MPAISAERSSTTFSKQLQMYGIYTESDEVITYDKNHAVLLLHLDHSAEVVESGCIHSNEIIVVRTRFAVLLRWLTSIRLTLTGILQFINAIIHR